MARSRASSRNALPHQYWGADPYRCGAGRGPRSLDRRHYRPAPVLGRPRGSASEAPSLVAAGIAVGGLLGIWLKSFEAIFWIAFFLAVFAAGFLNQVGKGPHFSLRFGAISFAVVAGLPAIETLDYVYWGLAVMISLASRSADHFINGPLPLRRTLVRRGFIRSMGLGSLFAGLRAGGNHRSLDRHRVGKHSRGMDFGHNLGAHGA